MLKSLWIILGVLVFGWTLLSISQNKVGDVGTIFGLTLISSIGYMIVVAIVIILIIVIIKWAAKNWGQ